MLSPYTLENNLPKARLVAEIYVFDISMDRAKLNAKFVTKTLQNFQPCWAWAVRTEVLEYDGSRQAYDLFFEIPFQTVDWKVKEKTRHLP